MGWVLHSGVKPWRLQFLLNEIKELLSHVDVFYIMRLGMADVSATRVG